jgi:NAD-dependent deacetylase
MALPPDDPLDRDDWARRALGRVLVVSGAGLSADSGLATFRGAGGLWNDPALARLATPQAFREDPDGVLAWYGLRRERASAAQPSEGHEAVARFARAAADFLCLTQNVDDLHERGGLDDGQVVHIHGRLHRVRCTRCERSWPDPIETTGPQPCACDARRRPDVVWFGERLPVAEIARVERFLAHGACDLVLVVGTTADFPYIVEWSLRARGRTGLLVEVNPDETELTAAADVVVRERAAVALPALADAAGIPA